MKTKKEDIDEKIDNLAIMVSKEFNNVHKEIKEFREEINQNLENHIRCKNELR
jgi:hypothetical protein